MLCAAIGAWAPQGCAATNRADARRGLSARELLRKMAVWGDRKRDPPRADYAGGSRNRPARSVGAQSLAASDRGSGGADDEAGPPVDPGGRTATGVPARRRGPHPEHSSGARTPACHVTPATSLAIVMLHGAHVFPDTNALFQGENAQPLYTVNSRRAICGARQPMRATRSASICGRIILRQPAGSPASRRTSVCRGMRTGRFRRTLAGRGFALTVRLHEAGASPGRNGRRRLPPC